MCWATFHATTLCGGRLKLQVASPALDKLYYSSSYLICLPQQQLKEADEMFLDVG